jgi:hypothetical protein
MRTYRCWDAFNQIELSINPKNLINQFLMRVFRTANMAFEHNVSYPPLESNLISWVALMIDRIGHLVDDFHGAEADGTDSF